MRRAGQECRDDCTGENGKDKRSNYGDTFVEEFQMKAIGGMMAAWELWERALIPSVLSGAGTWFGMKKCKKAIEMFDSLQNYSWRVMLTVPESCPKIALRCETGMMGGFGAKSSWC